MTDAKANEIAGNQVIMNSVFPGVVEDANGTRYIAEDLTAQGASTVSQPPSDELVAAFYRLLEWLEMDTLELMDDTRTMGITFDQVDSNALRREIDDAKDALKKFHERAAAPVSQWISFKSFAEMNRQRCEAPNGFNHQLSSWSTSDWFVAILGELGEAANIAKKLNRVRDGVRGNKETEQQLRDKLRQELGDTMVYLDLIAQALGFNIGDAAMEVFKSKSKEIGYALPAPPKEKSKLIGGKNGV